MADILVIEDMTGVQRAISSMLKHGGHQVFSAEDGQHGLELLKQRRFDLVITDMLMPNMDGTEVLFQLSNMANRPPVIAMSGGGAGLSAETALKAAQLKADAFLQKPFEKIELLSLVDRLINR